MSCVSSDRPVCPLNPQKSRAGVAVSPVGSEDLAAETALTLLRPRGVRERQYSCRVDVCVCPRNHSGDTLPYLCENETFRGCWSDGRPRSAFTERSVCVFFLFCFLPCVLQLPKWTQPDKKNDFGSHLILHKQMYREKLICEG